MRKQTPCTERHDAEEELRRSEEFYRSLVEQAADGIFLLDGNGNFLLANQEFCRMLGYAPEELQKLNILDTYPDELRDMARERHDRIGSGEKWDFERMIARKDGSVFPVEMSARRLADGKTQGIARDLTNHKITGAIGVSRDVTERRQTEQKNLRLAAMIESSKDAIIGVDLDDSVTSWNKAAEKVFGYTAEEMIGKPMTILLPPDVQTEQPASKEKLMRKGCAQQFENLVRRKDGTSVYVSTTFSPIQDATGLLVGITSISRDITDQRALQVQIIRSQRLESLATLAGGVAHQFNNINAGIMGYLDIVAKDTNLPSPTQSYVKEALKAVHRAVELTERLQGLTTGASTEAESLRLEEVVPTLFPLFEAKLQADGIAIRTDFQETPPVRANHAMVCFIVTCLLTNSLHALLDRPSPLITLRTRSVEGFSSLEVSDTGCGIPPEDLPRIFTPFFTTKGEWAEPTSPQSRVRGVGLSLAVCQSSVSESGGWIEAESIHQQCSTFRVWFPAATSENGKRAANPRT